MQTQEVVRRPMNSVPIVIPRETNGPAPFLARFAELPNAGTLPPCKGSTYLGTTSGPSGEDGDYSSDD